MNDDPARARWLAIQAVRWTGLGVFLLGMLVYSRKIDLPMEAGYVLIAVGLIDALFMPTLLVRKWKSRQ